MTHIPGQRPSQSETNTKAKKLARGHLIENSGEFIISLHLTLLYVCLPGAYRIQLRIKATDFWPGPAEDKNLRDGYIIVDATNGLNFPIILMEDRKWPHQAYYGRF